MAERKLRLGKEQQEQEQPTSEQRAAEAIVRDEVEAVELTDQEVESLIDAAYEWDVEQKRLKKMVDVAKATLKDHAMAEKWKTRMGDSATCVVGQSSSTEVATVTEFARFLKREGKLSLFDDLTKVQLGAAKKYLGEVALEPLLTKHVTEYGTISLKPIKGRKKTKKR